MAEMAPPEKEMNQQPLLIDTLKKTKSYKNAASEPSTI